MRTISHSATRRPMDWPGYLVAVLLVGGSGCGYSLGYRTPPGVHTVSVPIFLNETFPLRREVEYELTSAFRQEIQVRTGLRIIDEEAGPDLVVRGRILEFRERVVAEGPRDVKTESNLIAVVELRIENYRNNTIRIQRVPNVEPFSIEIGETFQDGRRRAVRNIAEKLVVALEDWEGRAPDRSGIGEEVEDSSSTDPESDVPSTK